MVVKSNQVICLKIETFTRQFKSEPNINVFEKNLFKVWTKSMDWDSECVRGIIGFLCTFFRSNNKVSVNGCGLYQLTDKTFEAWSKVIQYWGILHSTVGVFYAHMCVISK